MPVTVLRATHLEAQGSLPRGAPLYETFTSPRRDVYTYRVPWHLRLALDTFIEASSFQGQKPGTVRGAAPCTMCTMYCCGTS